MKDILNAHLTELVNNVENGDTSPLEAWFEMKQMLDKVKWSMGLIEDAAINEREAIGADDYKVDGFRIEVVQGRKMYSYKHIGKWKELEVHRKQVEQAAKVAADTGNMVVDPYGEEIEPAELSFGKSYLKATAIR